MRVKLSVFLFSIMICALGIALIVLTHTQEESFGAIILRFFACLFFVYCIIKGKGETRFLNPYWLFSFTPLSLILYTEKISTYYLMPLNTITWITALINIVAFLIGLGLIKNRKRREIVTELIQPSLQDAWIMFIVGHIPWFLHRFGFILPLESVISLFTFPGIVLMIGSKKKKAIILMTILQLLMMAIGGINKTGFLFTVMAFAVGIEAYYVHDEKSKRRFFLFEVITALVFIIIIFPLKDYFALGNGISGFIGSNWNSTADYYSSRVQYIGPRTLMMPYMYFISSWNNLQYVMQTQTSHTYGLWSIKPLLGYFQLDKFFSASYSLKSYSSFNTFTYITVLFKDFGILGSTFLSLFLGLFVGYVYEYKYLSTDYLDICCYSMVACATAEMFFSNHFFTQSYPFTILIIIWLYKLLKKSVERKH